MRHLHIGQGILRIGFDNGILSQVLASAVAAKYATHVKDQIAQDPGRTPVLVGFLANGDPFARKYADWTAKTCAEVGITFELRECTRTQLELKLDEANSDSNVDGIMIYYPCFGGAQDQYLQNTVSVSKVLPRISVDVTQDVEGLSHTYRSNMYRNIRFLDQEKTRKCIIPCTPLAIIKILEFVGVYNPILEEGNRLHGRTITVINRSEVVGRPLAALMANDGANVYSVDVNDILFMHRGSGLSLERHEIEETSITFQEALAKSDVVIGGVPNAEYKIPTSILKEGVVAINFSSYANFQDDLLSKASIFVPSVGKVTISMLIRNLVRLKMQRSV
ncbi:MAG: hypothetical protein SGCHY_000575 [Lobulomycetales sp.]